MQIITRIVSHFQQNARVIKDTETKKSCILDPGASAFELVEDALRDGYDIESIFLTHCHIDHGGGVKGVLRKIEAKGLNKPALYFHSDGQLLADNIESYGTLYGFTSQDYENIPKPDHDCRYLETFSIGNLSAKVLQTPGHAPGHVSLYFDVTSWSMSGDYAEPNKAAPILISGDALFRGSIGRTDLPGADHTTLIDSIKNELLPLPENTIVLSGHGPNTTIEMEKRNNPFLK